MDYDIVAGVGPNKVLVVGAGKTGIAVARFCQLRGAQVTVTDMRTGAELHAAMQTLGERVTWELGKHIQRSFLDADLIVVSPGVPDMGVNADDPFFAHAAYQRRSYTRVLSYSGQPRHHAAARDAIIDGFVDGADLVALGERYPIDELNLVGRHNLGNALAAILLMRGNDLVPYDAVRRALGAFRPLPHRMQL